MPFKWITATLLSVFAGAYLAFSGLGSLGVPLAWLWIIPIIIKEDRRSSEAEEKKPETTEDLRSAVFEAMDTVADENIN